MLRESRFSHDTQEIAYLAPLGRAITLRGIVYGKGSKRKKECILFSLKTFSHKTVSNHSVIILLRGPCPPSAALPRPVPAREGRRWQAGLRAPKSPEPFGLELMAERRVEGEHSCLQECGREIETQSPLSCIAWATRLSGMD